VAVTYLTVPKLTTDFPGRSFSYTGTVSRQTFYSVILTVSSGNIWKHFCSLPPNSPSSIASASEAPHMALYYKWDYYYIISIIRSSRRCSCTPWSFLVPPLVACYFTVMDIVCHSMNQLWFHSPPGCVCIEDHCAQFRNSCKLFENLTSGLCLLYVQDTSYPINNCKFQ